MSSPERFAELAKALEKEHVERSDEIHAALLALVAGTTLFLLGEPGVAKSMLARRIHAYVSGGEFFDIDLDKFSTAEDLFGPRSLGALKDNRWEREVGGTLVTCDWAFIDEFFEAPSSLLKTMLRALRERTYRNGTEIHEMPLTTLFAASNEVPTEPRLQPLYDRLVIRRQVKRIADRGNVLRMLELAPVEHPDSILTWEEVLVAQTEAAQVKAPDQVLVAMLDIREGLDKADIRPSDRRFVEALKVLRAEAWLDRCDVIEPTHLRCLRDVFWTAPDQIPAVAQIIDQVVEPLASELDVLHADVLSLRRQIRSGLGEVERKQLAVELHDKIRRARMDLDALAARSNGKRQQAKVEATEALISSVSQEVIRDLFLVDPETGKPLEAAS